MVPTCLVGCYTHRAYRAKQRENQQKTQFWGGSVPVKAVMSSPVWLWTGSQWGSTARLSLGTSLAEKQRFSRMWEAQGPEFAVGMADPNVLPALVPHNLHYSCLTLPVCTRREWIRCVPILNTPGPTHTFLNLTSQHVCNSREFWVLWCSSLPHLQALCPHKHLLGVFHSRPWAAGGFTSHIPNPHIGQN